jgi:hypothetical protein
VNNNVELWGFQARSNYRKKNNKKPVEFFKLHLGNLPDHLKPYLPIGHKKAITDYFGEIGKV